VLSKQNEKVKYRDFWSIDNAPEEKERGITINIAHVEYETKARTTRTSIVPARGLREEHDHGSGADGRGDPGGFGGGRAVPQTREHILLARQVNVPAIVVFMNKCDMVEDKEILDLVELEIRELLSSYGFPGTRYRSCAAAP